jgi:hypothetical protein
MTRTPAEIAAGLTKAQREAFLAADVSDLRCPHCSVVYWDFPECMSAYPAHWNPDCLPEDDGGTEWTWEPLGLAVRAELMKENDDG